MMMVGRSEQGRPRLASRPRPGRRGGFVPLVAAGGEDGAYLGDELGLWVAGGEVDFPEQARWPRRARPGDVVVVTR